MGSFINPEAKGVFPVIIRRDEDGVVIVPEKRRHLPRPSTVRWTLVGPGLGWGEDGVVMTDSHWDDGWGEPEPAQGNAYELAVDDGPDPGVLYKYEVNVTVDGEPESEDPEVEYD